MDARQPRLTAKELSPAQRALYDEIVGGPRAGGAFALTDENGALVGPFGGFLLSPDVGEALQQLGASIRYRTQLSDRMRELAILTVAQREGSTFERRAHEAVGRAVGLTDREMGDLGSGRVPSLAEPSELAVVRLTRALTTGDVSDEDWAHCVSLLGLRTAYELIVLVGYYTTLALQMRVLRVDQDSPSLTTRST